MVFSINSQAFKEAYQFCLILQTAEATSLETLLQEFVAPDVLENKLASYNFNFVLSNILNKLSKAEKLALLAYINFAFWPRQLTYLILEEPDLLLSLLANTWQNRIEDYNMQVAKFDDCVSLAQAVELETNLQTLATKQTGKEDLVALTNELVVAGTVKQHNLNLSDLPSSMLQAQANYNCLRILTSLQSLTSAYLLDNKFWPKCVNQASLRNIWRIIATSIARYFDKLSVIDQTSDEMSSFIIDISKSLAPLYLPELNKLAEKYLTKLRTSAKNVLHNDSTMLFELGILFAANKAFFDSKKTSLYDLLQKESSFKFSNQELSTFRHTFFTIFDTALNRNSGNIYLVEFLLEANDTALAKRLYDYVEPRYSRASLSELKDGQKEWLRALSHYGLKLREN